MKNWYLNFKVKRSLVNEAAAFPSVTAKRYNRLLQNYFQSEKAE